MRILCTFPGRHGDLLWALPTMRAISEAIGAPVDLQIAGEFAGMLDLLRLQPYLGQVCANPHWGMDTWEAPRPVGTPEGTYDGVVHLGYRRWPELPLPLEIARLAAPLIPNGIDLSRAWITAVPWTQIPHRIVIGWSDCWFELKVGLLALLQRRLVNYTSAFMLAAPGSRWTSEQPYVAVDWVEAARRIAAADVFLGDCSALHVLALALGIPVVLVEPMEARWNPIFYPYGTDGYAVQLVRGLDGKPTFDARHVGETLQAVLDGR
jgi:hypothetical protein